MYVKLLKEMVMGRWSNKIQAQVCVFLSHHWAQGSELPGVRARRAHKEQAHPILTQAVKNAISLN